MTVSFYKFYQLITEALTVTHTPDGRSRTRISLCQLRADCGQWFCVFITNQKAPVVLKGLSSPKRKQGYKGSSYELKETEAAMNARIRSDRYVYSPVLANVHQTYVK